MTSVATIEPRPRSVLIDMADRYGMAPEAFEATVRATCMSGQNVSREHFAAFLLVAKEYGLNPLTKEIYAFPAKGGGIQPIVSIDGWMRMINDHPAFDGLEFVDELDGDNLVSVTCKIFRRDRTRPISVIEYMSECRRATDVWRQWPRRMLRHKAAIQCARYAFGFSGIMDPDEVERMVDVTPRQSMAERLAASRAQQGGFSSARVEHEIAGAITSQQPKEEPHQDQTHATAAEAETMDENALGGPHSEAGNGSTAAGLDAGQDGATPSTESNLSDAATGSDGRTESGDDAPPSAPLSVDDRRFLGEYAKALRPGNAPRDLAALREKFAKDNPGRGFPEGHVGRAISQSIYAIETKRAVGELSIEDADARIEGLLS